MYGAFEGDGVWMPTCEQSVVNIPVEFAPEGRSKLERERDATMQEV